MRMPKNKKDLTPDGLAKTQKAKEYAKAYREKNKEKIKAQIAEWRANNPDYSKEYAEKNKEKLKEQREAYIKRPEVKERICAASRERYHADREGQIKRVTEYQQRNKDKKSEWNRKWREANPDKIEANRIRWVENNPGYGRRYYEINKEKMAAKRPRKPPKIQLSEEEKLALKRKKDRDRHRAKVEKDPEGYRQKNKEKCKAYREKNMDKVRAKNREWYWSNRERILAEAKTKGWHKGDPRGALERQRKYRKTIKGRAIRNASGSRRRARLLAATTEDHDAGIERRLYTQCAKLSEIYGGKFQVDHRIPLAIGGRHHHSNLRVLPDRLNNLKRARLDEEVEEILNSPWVDVDCYTDYIEFCAKHL